MQRCGLLLKPFLFVTRPTSQPFLLHSVSGSPPPPWPESANSAACRRRASWRGMSGAPSPRGGPSRPRRCCATMTTSTRRRWGGGGRRRGRRRPRRRRCGACSGSWSATPGSRSTSTPPACRGCCRCPTSTWAASSAKSSTPAPPSTSRWLSSTNLSSFLFLLDVMACFGQRCSIFAVLDYCYVCFGHSLPILMEMCTLSSRFIHRLAINWKKEFNFFAMAPFGIIFIGFLLFLYVLVSCWIFCSSKSSCGNVPIVPMIFIINVQTGPQIFGGSKIFQFVNHINHHTLWNEI